MRIIFVCINFFIFLTPNVFWAQASTMTSVKDSDPKAKAVLDKLKKQYDAYKTMEVKFELEVEMPGQTTAIQKGSLVQDGAKYQLKLPDQEIYADGKTSWLYLKKNKEVQINDMGTEDNSLFISPSK
jgi:outer membrane lipoprotein-sorting protein